jgi:A/G-specific adenine glycosylase
VASDSTLRRQLLAWYDHHRRTLPWRASPGLLPDPYHVLVSEAMLQQTQVATVVPYFQRFVARWPSLADLAQAQESDVLRLWQGLGYYRRARYLLATARVIQTQHGGCIPRTVGALRELPGIGPYTAGAIASLAFDLPEPIVDGNVARVLSRLEGRAETGSALRQLLWRRAGQLVQGPRAADFNSALMELGALVCTPRQPACDSCPWAATCRAREAGNAQELPRREPARTRPLEHYWIMGLRRRGRFLIEQRPSSGRWAGMWQFPTILARRGSKPTSAWLKKQFGVSGRIAPVGQLRQDLTHRRCEFAVFLCEISNSPLPGATSEAPRRWITLKRLSDYALPQAQLRAIKLFREVA